MYDNLSMLPSIEMLMKVIDGLRYFESNKDVISPMSLVVYNKKFAQLATIQTTSNRLLDQVSKLNSEIVEEKYLRGNK